MNILNMLVSNPVALGVLLKLVLDFKVKGKDIVDLFPDAMKPAVAAIVANVLGIALHLATGDITPAGLLQAFSDGFMHYTVAGGFATGFDQAVQSWNATHGISGTAVAPAPKP